MKAVISLKNRFFVMSEVQGWTYQDNQHEGNSGILEVFLRHREKPMRIFCTEDEMKDMIKTIEAIRGNE